MLPLNFPLFMAYIMIFGIAKHTKTAIIANKIIGSLNAKTAYIY